MKFEEKLYSLREEKKISQNELAEILDVSRQAISKWEMGRAMPDTKHLILISQYFNVSLDYLVNDDINDKDTKTHVRKDISNEENTVAEKCKKKIISRILIVILLLAILICGNLFHSPAGSSIIFFSIVIVLAISAAYTRIRDLFHQKNNQKEGGKDKKSTEEKNKKLKN